MDTKLHDKLLERIYLVMLLILLLNDFIFKYTYPGIITGKLSDFAGLFLLPVFLSITFNVKSPLLFLFVSGLFILWKLPISDKFICSWNNFIPLNIDRVVDPSDCIALVSVFFAYYMVKLASLKIEITINYFCVGLISLFAFSATSYYNEIETTEELIIDSGILRTKKIIMSMDSTTLLSEIDTNSIKSDTLSIKFYYDFCFDGFVSKLAVSGDSLESNVSILQLFHDCPLNKDQIWGQEVRSDKEFLTRIVKKKIIKSFE